MKRTRITRRLPAPVAAMVAQAQDAARQRAAVHVRDDALTLAAEARADFAWLIRQRITDAPDPNEYDYELPDGFRDTLG